MIQTEKHECERKPDFVYINKTRIDGEWTEWTASFTATTREGSATSNIEELVGDLYHEGYENGWNHCASQATHDYTDEWCDGFLTAWNAIAHEGRGWCRNEGDRFRFECSECGFLDAYATADFINYCPNCGAKVVD